jgi:hypothetical protein
VPGWPEAAGTEADADVVVLLGALAEGFAVADGCAVAEDGAVADDCAVAVGVGVTSTV